MTRRWCGLWLVLPMLGCAGPPTEIVLVVDGDLSPGTDVDLVTIDLESPGGATGTIEVPLDGPTSPGFPLTLALTPVGEALSPVVVAVEARRGGRPVVRTGAVTAFLEHERRALPLGLDRACVGLDCPGEHAICADGVCVDRRVPARGLPALPPDL